MGPPLGKFIIFWKQKTGENVVRSGRIDSELIHRETVIEAVKMDEIIEKMCQKRKLKS